MIKLRTSQLRTIDALRASIASGKRAPIVVAPTGMGKSVCIGHVAHGAYQKGKRVVVVAHRQEIVGQNAQKIEAFGIKCGLVMAGVDLDPDCEVYSASIQTLARRQLPWEPDILIVDECHLGLARTYLDLYARWPNALLIGWTATPERLDGRGLGEKYDDIVMGPTIKQLQSEGHLSPMRCYAPPAVADLTGVKARGGDFASEELVKRMKKDGVTGDAIEHYKRLGGGKSAVCFCCNVEHAQETAKAFRDAGITSEAVDGSMGGDERHDILARSASGECRVLCSVDLVACGYDSPNLKVSIWLRPTMSLVIFLQGCGRTLRPWNDEETIVLDHVGNIARHGMPNADRTWSLESKTRKANMETKDTVSPYTCGNCFGMTVRPATHCACCGAEIPIDRREIPKTAGELREIKEAEVAAEKEAFRRERSACRTPDELVKFAVKHGYKSPNTWAMYIIEAREQKKARTFRRP